ncbi:tyrosine-type recombinase/integrase [Cellulosimicrobium cellulans]|uniref:tyrosine-type recombinase/integrase n=1 Tax=Cellulosimicrobium cellulans TaxID=1710 RepID=UPI0036E2A9DD
MFQRYVPGAPIASLTLRQVTVPAVRTFLQGIADTKGAGAAKSVRSILSGILGMAVHDGVIDVNAARQVRAPQPQAPIARSPGRRRGQALGLASAEYAERDTRRAFTRAERDALVSFAQSDDWARERDVADLVAFLAALGPRISEAISLRWDDVDLAAGTVRIRGTKTKTSDRTLAMPSWLIDVLAARATRLDPDAHVYVFGAPRAVGKERDTRAVARHLRTVLDRAGMPWATPHTFRRTVASLIADGGLSVALAADVLGHADASFTARVYLGRGGDTARAAALL